MTCEDFLKDILLGEKVKTKNLDLVIEKLRKIKQGGLDKLQIITDFDRTISKHHNNGVLTKSSYCVFEKIPGLPEQFFVDAKSLCNRFKSIEDNPKMTIDEKIPHMKEWWRLKERLYVGLPYDLEKINQAVLDSGVTIRDRCEACFKSLNKKGVPILVFSAGLGEIVTAILKQHNILFDNMKVISNFFKIVDGKIAGFDGMPINIFNKNQHAIKNCNYFKTLSQKTNVIIMGDSLGDANMDEGVTPGGSVLKIGYLSIHIDEYLPQYLEHFDIVLLNDQTMDVFEAILSFIL